MPYFITSFRVDHDRGLPPAPRTVDQLEALAATLPAGPMPSLLIDEPEHAMRRTRVALNRESTWLAVRHARSKKTPAEAPRHCTACAPASGPPQAETAMHVIAHCPRYADRRESLRHKLHGVIDRMRDRAMDIPRWRHIINDKDSLFFHCVLASPFVLDGLRPKHRKSFCVTTGRFLDFLITSHPT